VLFRNLRFSRETVFDGSIDQNCCLVLINLKLIASVARYMNTIRSLVRVEKFAFVLSFFHVLALQLLKLLRLLRRSYTHKSFIHIHPHFLILTTTYSPSKGFISTYKQPCSCQAIGLLAVCKGILLIEVIAHINKFMGSISPQTCLFRLSSQLLNLLKWAMIFSILTCQSFSLCLVKQKIYLKKQNLANKT